MGWEKGTGKKWGKSKKKGGTDLSLEEMKKQAAVQCLRSASDEVSTVLLDCCDPVVLQVFITRLSWVLFFFKCALIIKSPLWKLTNRLLNIIDFTFEKLVNEKWSEYKRHGGTDYLRNLLL